MALSDNTAQLDLFRNAPLTLMQETRADGYDWPRALTYIGERATAIVILERATCQLNAVTHPFEVQILTQRGTVPVVLTGCCAGAP